MKNKKKRQSLNALEQEIVEICEVHGIKPSRSKGQNFLINQAVYDAIVTSAEIQATDTVLEIGPGLGYLTTGLAQVAGQVIAVELDDNLSGFLVNKFRTAKLTNIQVINADILHWPHLTGLSELPQEYKIVSNLPYNITSFFLRQFLSVHDYKPRTMTLMLQDEVAKRLCPRAGEMSLLGLSAEFYSEVKYLFKVPAQDFWPAPKVNSAVVHLQLHDAPLAPESAKLFFRLARIGFSAKRKMLKKNIINGVQVELEQVIDAFDTCQIDHSVRAEDLSLKQWLALFGELQKFML